MGLIDRKDVQSAYKKEAGSLIKKIKKGLSSFSEKRTARDARRLFRLFRYAHTLKGISGTCGYYKIETAAQSVTEIFRAAKDGERKLGAKDKVVIRKKLNACEKHLERGL